jgi:hypothetical protein
MNSTITITHRAVTASVTCALLTSLAASLLAASLAGDAHAASPAGTARRHTTLARAQQLSRDLTDLAGRYRAATPSERNVLSPELDRVAAARGRLLAALLARDPGAVAEAALPAPVRAGLPRDVRRQVERPATVEGIVHVLVEDRRRSRTHHVLATDSGQNYALHLAAGGPELRSGSRIRLRGIRVGGGLALDASARIRLQGAPALQSTLGEQRSAVIVVNFQNKPGMRPFSVDQVRDIVFTKTSDFFREASAQQTWLAGDVFGWYTIPVDSRVCDPFAISRAADAAAAAAGADLSRYARLVYVFPANACGWWGLGTVGGSPSRAWIRANPELRVVGHEMLHNFGLQHSHGLECGNFTVAANCSVAEYGDTLDIMGKPAAAHPNAFQKERLGWFDPQATAPVTVVETDGTYRIDPYESSSSSPKALKILKAVNPTTGERSYLYVEYRQALGADAFLAGRTEVLRGVVVHIGAELAGRSYLLDMTPRNPWNTPALTAGQPFVDPDGATLQLVAADPTGATVTVTLPAASN